MGFKAFIHKPLYSHKERAAAIVGALVFGLAVPSICLYGVMLLSAYLGIGTTWGTLANILGICVYFYLTIVCCPYLSNALGCLVVVVDLFLPIAIAAYTFYLTAPAIFGW